MPPSEILKILDSCKKLITIGRSQEALDKLLLLKQKKFEKKFILLSNQFYESNRNKKINIITDEQHRAIVNLINLNLLNTIEDLKKELEESACSQFIGVEKPIPKFGLTISIATILVIVTIFLFFNLKKIEAIPDEPIKCLDGNKIVVLIAPFQDNSVDGFSSSVIADLRNNLEDSIFRVGSIKFSLSFLDNKDYQDSIKRGFSKCDTSGLFVGGLWEKEDQVFNCYIDPINLSSIVPKWQINETIILNNSTNIKFSIKEDAKFLANFIIGILKINTQKPYEALKMFNLLEKDSLVLGDLDLIGYISLFKAQCFTMLADYENARKYYEYAISLGSIKIKNVATNNYLQIIDQLALSREEMPELMRLFSFNMQNDLENLETSWLKNFDLMFQNMLPIDLNIDVKRKIYSIAVAVITFQRERFQKVEISKSSESLDTTLNWHDEYNKFIFDEIRKQILYERESVMINLILDRLGEYISIELFNSHNVPDEDIAKLLGKINTDVTEIVDGINNEAFEVAGHKFAMPGRKINFDNPNSKELMDITDPRNSQAREELYQKYLRKKERGFKNSQPKEELYYRKLSKRKKE